jgi:hypothetical protein
VLPVSLTIPPVGVSTPLDGSLTLADAAELLRTTELSARHAALTAIIPRVSRVVPINLVTGSLLVRWLLGVALAALADPMNWREVTLSDSSTIGYASSPFAR